MTRPASRPVSVRPSAVLSLDHYDWLNQLSSLFDRLVRSTRMVLFETIYEEWKYASHGGTVFVVALAGKPYGITNRHVVGDFAWDDLCVPNRRTDADAFAAPKAICYPSDLKKGAEGTDLGDIAVIEFRDDVELGFFGEDFFPLEASIVPAHTGDDLIVYGALKEKSTIADRKIMPTFASLGFQDDGPHSHDPFLRNCSAYWASPEFTSISGLSGSPVFNETRNGLTGLMIRGGLSGNNATGLYLDFEDVFRVLQNVHEGVSHDDYFKPIRQGQA